MKTRFLLFFLLLFSAKAFAAPDTARVLFIGNSFTGVNDLPEVTAQLALSLGDVLIKTSQAIGGASLQMHSTNAGTLGYIRAGGWNYVVLQEQSQAPAFPEAQVQTDVYPYAKLLCDSIRRYNPCAKIMFYMTWGYRTGDPANCPNYTPLCTYEGMDSLLRLRYKAMSDSNDALLCPVGATWRRIRGLYPGINLYDADDHHPSPEGTYAGACSFYAAIFRKSPVGAAYSFSIAPADAANIRLAAKAVAYDSLAYWRQWYMPTLKVKAAFSNTTGSKTVAFSNTSQNGLTYNWSFGDGSAAATAAPSHTYAAGGTYTVRLIATSQCGDKDTLQKQIVVSPSAVSSMAVPELHIVPNPAHDVVEISAAGNSIVAVRVMDMQGRTCMSYAPEAVRGAVLMNIAALPGGVYMLSATLRNGLQARQRIVKD